MHQNMDGITAFRMDKIVGKKRHHYLTVVYQIDRFCIRLLWAGEERKATTWSSFLTGSGGMRNAINSGIAPMQKVVCLLRRHHELILNWFRSQKTISSGPAV